MRCCSIRCGFFKCCMMWMWNLALEICLVHAKYANNFSWSQVIDKKDLWGKWLQMKVRSQKKPPRRMIPLASMVWLSGRGGPAEELQKKDQPGDGHFWSTQVALVRNVGVYMSFPVYLAWSSAKMLVMPSFGCWMLPWTLKKGPTCGVSRSFRLMS